MQAGWSLNRLQRSEQCCLQGHLLFSLPVCSAGREEAESGAAAPAAEARDADEGHAGPVREQHERAPAAAGTVPGDSASRALLLLQHERRVVRSGCRGLSELELMSPCSALGGFYGHIQMCPGAQSSECLWLMQVRFNL